MATAAHVYSQLYDGSLELHAESVPVQQFGNITEIQDKISAMKFLWQIKMI